MNEQQAFQMATDIIRACQVGKLPQEKYKILRASVVLALQKAGVDGFKEGVVFGQRVGYQNGYTDGATETRRLYESRTEQDGAAKERTENPA
jgi:hypothetical protein